MQNMTKGNPLKLIVMFSLPIMVGMIFQQLYALSDVVLVGHFLGMQSLAAVGAIMAAFVVVLSTIMGFSNGLGIIAAQHFGANEEDEVRRSYATGLVLSGIVGLITTIAMVVGVDSILWVMNIPEEIMVQSASFIHMISYGLLATIYYNYLSSIMRALGDSRTPLYFLIFACVMNILLNIFFIVVLHLGVAGSALGTVCAQTISVGLCLIWLYYKFPILRLKKHYFRIRWSDVVEHCKVAVPMAFQFFILGSSMAITQRICNELGPDVIAGFTAAARIEQLFIMPLISLGVGMATYAAQNFGARRISRIKRGVFQVSMLSLTISVIMAVTVFFFGGTLASMVMKDPTRTVISTAQIYLQITTLFYCFLGQIFIFRQALQGMGHAFIPFMSSIVEFFMRLIAAVFLAAYFGFVGLSFSSPAAWIGAVAVTAGGYFIVIRRYRDGRCLGRPQRCELPISEPPVS